MTQVDIVYQGALRCAATHVVSGSVLVTDAPTDNHGKGESFSPTDLVATALGTCMMTIMGIAARRLDIDLTGSTVTVEKEMAAQPSRRIATLRVTVGVPLALSDVHKQRLMDAAMACPVHQSLHPDVRMPITFQWA
jgi:putative redox protein